MLCGRCFGIRRELLSRSKDCCSWRNRNPVAEQTGGSAVSLNECSWVNLMNLVLYSWDCGAGAAQELLLWNSSTAHTPAPGSILGKWDFKKLGHIKEGERHLPSLLPFPSHPLPSPAGARQPRALLLLCWQEGNSWDVIALQESWNAFPLLPQPFPSVPRWRRAGLAGQAALALEAPHFHGELLQRSERSRGGLGAMGATGMTPCSVTIPTSELIPEEPVWLGQPLPNSPCSLRTKQNCCSFGIRFGGALVPFSRCQCRNFACCAFRNGKAK